MVQSSGVIARDKGVTSWSLISDIARFDGMSSGTNSDPWATCQRPPRQWQREALNAIGVAWGRGQRPVVRAVTGSGKSGLLSRLASLMAGPEGVVVISAPRIALVEQLSGLESEETRAEWGGGFRPGSVAWDAGADSVGVYYGERKILDRRIIVTCNSSLPSLVDELAGRKCRALIVDEAHRSESALFAAAVEALRPMRRVGFTATPWRSEKTESLSMFDSLAYDYGFSAALRDGVIVPWDIGGWDGRGDSEIDGVCLRLIARYGEGPGIVSAASISDATMYAETLSQSGIPAMAIHSKLSASDRRSRIDRLLSGDLRCLVHVALLQEGVDIPALRWLCMRRPGASSIRFTQELGRVLRSAPGKDRALLLDPYDLAGSIGLVHNPAVGPAQALDDLLAQEAAASDRVASHGIKEEEERPPAVMVSELTRWARRSLLALVEAGIAATPLRGTGWRDARPTDAQLDTLRRMGGDMVRATLRHAEHLTRGEVSDMIGYLSAFRWACRQGQPLPDIEPIPHAAIVALSRRGVAL